MKYKLVDVIRQVEEDVTFGTCDLCEHVGTHHYDVLVLEDENGLRMEVENGFWSWGDYMELWNIRNYVNFAYFIKDIDVEITEETYTAEAIMHVLYEKYRDEVDEW